MKTAATLAIGAVVICGALLLIIFAGQRRFIYPAPMSGAAIAAAGFGAATLHTADGLSLKALYQPARDSRRTVVFFHGNGDTLRGSLAATRAIAAAGYGVLLPEYRGYGGNPGHPDEAGLYADARAAAAFLGGHGVASGEIVAIGSSLGSGPATQLAVDKPLAGLIIVSGFTGLPAVAAQAMRLPIAALVRDRYDNAAKLARLNLPVLILHGDADRVIPVTHRRALAAAARQGSFVEFVGFGHELAYQPAATEAELKWLRLLDQ